MQIPMNLPLSTPGGASLSVRDLGERKLLALLAPLLPQSGDDILLSVGDDCCAVKPPAGLWTIPVTTIDMLAEGTHFLGTDRVSWEHVGRKAMASNISDIAAMGGRPEYAVIGLALPSAVSVASVLDLYRGMVAEAKEFGVRIIGGDTVRISPNAGVTLSITLSGYCRHDRPMPRRTNAAVGQNVFITGRVGGSKAGLELLFAPALVECFGTEDSASLMARHHLPKARVAAGQALVASCDDLAMIDISDSLMNECGLLCEASEVGIDLLADRLPMYDKLREYALMFGRDPLIYPLFSGEEYELLFCTSLDESAVRACLDAAGLRALDVTRIGRVVAGDSVRVLETSGKVRRVHDETFSHFA